MFFSKHMSNFTAEKSSVLKILMKTCLTTILSSTSKTQNCFVHPKDLTVPTQSLNPKLRSDDSQNETETKFLK